MRSIRTFLFVLTIILLLVPAAALAQGYSFNLAEEVVDLYIQEDGSADIRYVYTFNNDPSAGPIDYLDIGLPPYTFWSEGNISAFVNGQPVTDISASGYQGSGDGVAIGLGRFSIPPGASGQVEVLIENVQGMLFTAKEPENYASFEFSPVWFGSENVFGTTAMTVTFHLPPGVQPEEPRFFEAPRGWPEAPEAFLDEEGRVTYSWFNPSAEADERYEFGAAFPIVYVPEGVVQTPNIAQELGVDAGTIITVVLCGIFALVIGLIIIASYASTEKRKLQYLPPKVAIEGHGIKRGLTAVEAAILLEQPLDKVMTMILFSVIKKEAAQVATRDPLELEIASPLPANLRPYEEQFLQAFRESDKARRRRLLQDMTVDLVESVSNKMKGFSRAETIAYYRDIMNRAWAQVEAAETPEVKSEKFSENIEWTMLDRDYDDRTRRTFGGGPVYVPVWWPRYDPVYRAPGGPATRPAGQPSAPGGGGVRLPHLPGSDFAASVVNGVQTFAGSVIGNVAEFTGNVTQRTNPVPVATTPRGGGAGRSGGGCACACACACAGCACACAGGGR